MSFRVLVLGLLLATAAPSIAAPLASARRTIVLVSSVEARDTEDGRWLALIFREALRRIGYDFELAGYPILRAAKMADSGAVDGEINRAADYADGHPSLVRVDESLSSHAFAAYAGRPLTLGEGWAGLVGRGYRVECRAGVLRCETQTRQLLPAGQVSSVYSAQLALRKLQVGRTDLYIDVEEVVDGMLATGEFAGSPVRKVGVVEMFKGYAFLHQKNRALAAPLAAALAAMKREGLFEKYHQQVQARAAAGAASPRP